MQKWEYKIVVRRREVGLKGVLDGQAGKWDKEMHELLPALGNEGWELVSVTPRADAIGALVALTTSELWVFKRALEGA